MAPDFSSFEARWHRRSPGAVSRKGFGGLPPNFSLLNWGGVRRKPKSSRGNHRVTSQRGGSGDAPECLLIRGGVGLGGSRVGPLIVH